MPRWNERCAILAERAELLANQGREDEGALAELRTLAGKHLRDARAAALWFAEGCWNRESRQADRAYRLLMAVANENAVVAASSDALELFDRVDSLLALSHPEAFGALVKLEPRLAAVAQEAESGELGYRVDAPDFENAHTRSERDLVVQQARRYERSQSLLDRRLDALVGPRAELADELLRTQVARNVAEAYLDDLRPR